MTDKIICPIMSGQLVSPESITEVPCLGKKCALWVEITNDDGGHYHWEGCGLIKPRE